MSSEIKNGLSKALLSCFILSAISSPAFAKKDLQYPLDIELLGSGQAPVVVKNVRQQATVERMIVHVGKNDPSLDPQPEMICPTAKSPTIQEWGTPSNLSYPSRPVVSHQVTTKSQTNLHPITDAALRTKPVPIASAYPFNTGSSSYTVGGKSRSHRSELR